MIVCAKCNRAMRPKKNDTAFVEMAQDRPYKLWMADLLECQDCGAQVLYTTPQMEKSECKHCGVEIRLLTDFWGEYRPEWKHAFEDGQDYHYYQYCHCQCDACKPDTTLGIHDPCPANCCAAASPWRSCSVV